MRSDPDPDPQEYTVFLHLSIPPPLPPTPYRFCLHGSIWKFLSACTVWFFMHGSVGIFQFTWLSWRSSVHLIMVLCTVHGSTYLVYFLYTSYFIIVLPVDLCMSKFIIFLAIFMSTWLIFSGQVTCLLPSHQLQLQWATPPAAGWPGLQGVKVYYYYLSNKRYRLHKFHFNFCHNINCDYVLIKNY